MNQARNFLKHLKYSSLHTSKLSLFQKLVPENLRSQKRMKIPNKVDLTLQYFIASCLLKLPVKQVGIYMNLCLNNWMIFKKVMLFSLFFIILIIYLSKFILKIDLSPTILTHFYPKSCVLRMPGNSGNTENNQFLR